MRHFHVGDYFDKDEPVTITRNFSENIGDVNMSITDLKVPRQFMASSADQYVSFRMPVTKNFPNGSLEAKVVPPKLTSPTSGPNQGAGWMEVGNEISFTDRAAWVCSSYTLDQNTYPYYRLNEIEPLDASHVDWRVAKYSSQEEAVSKVNEALIASKINGRVYSDEFNRPIMVPLNESGFTDIHQRRPNTSIDLANFAFELYVYNNALAARTQQIILEFRSLSTALDNNFMKVDCGTFTFQPGLTRICPYDVFTGSDRAKPDEGPQRTTDANEDGTAYHSVKEVKRAGFERMATDLVGSLGCKLSHMRFVRLSPDTSESGSTGGQDSTSVSNNIKVGIAAYNYCATASPTLFYDSVAPALIPHKGSMGILKDARDADQYLYLSPVLANRLNLGPAMHFQYMERRMGDTAEENGVVVSKNRDMVQAYGVTPCLSIPSFNDVLAIAPCQLGEADSFDGRQGVSQKLASSFQFAATETAGHYEASNQVRPTAKKMRISANQVEFQMLALVANSITKKTERVAVKHGREGSEYAGLSFTADLL